MKRQQMLNGVLILGLLLAQGCGAALASARASALPATMGVKAAGTRIVFDGKALARATYAVMADREIGANDFCLSDMGGDTLFDAGTPAVAYNSQNDEYLLVWAGDDNTAPLLDDEYEIFGQRVHAATGAEIGGDLRLSDMGPNGNTSYQALEPAVAYNGQDNQYLVVWRGDDNTGALVDGEYEIFGQRVDAATGAEIGGDIRLSDMGPDGNALYGAYDPAVAYNGQNNEYLVLWSGDDNTAPQVDDEYEIFGQRVNAATGAQLSVDFRLSHMGPDGDTNYDAYYPAVAYDSTNNAYLVVWRGDDNTAPLVEGESEIFGQRVNAATGALVGADLRLSDMGPDGDANYDADFPAVAYNRTGSQYLVVWSGDDNTLPLVNDEFEIFGQRVEAGTGAQVGVDFRLSDMGPDGSASYGTGGPAVAYNSRDNQYLVAWQGDDNTAGLVDGEYEIFGQRVSAATGAEIGANDFRLSDMGPDGNTSYRAQTAALAYNSRDSQYLAVWVGDDNIAPLVNDEFEIFGQRLNAATGAEVGANDLRLSDMGGDDFFDAYSPAVAYNSTNNEYLVVWQGDDNTAGLVDGENEIFGQRVDAATGAEIGGDIRLSDMGPDGNVSYDAGSPAVAYNSTDNQYLVVWYGDDNTAPLVDGEYEVFGQRVEAATGAEIGSDFRLSDMGLDGNTSYGAVDPAVVYNSADNEYLVVWSGDDDTAPLVNGEQEIFGQRVNAATGAQTGANDFRLSDMGPDGDVNYLASGPTVAYNRTNNQYLVVWVGDDNTFPLVNDEFEIFGQRVDGAKGGQIGTDSRLSDMGPDGNATYGAGVPAVAYNRTNNEYLVVWTGDDNTPPLVEGESEIFGQRVNAATGAEIGTNDLRLSDMGPDGDPNYDASFPSVAYSGAEEEYLVVWQSDDNTGALVNDESEVFGQRVKAAGGAEIGGDVRLSDMGPDGDANYDAYYPAVACNSVGNEYLVVWQGEDNTPPLVSDEFEIFGQRFAGARGLYLPLLLRNY